MLIPLKWLKEYVDIDLTPGELGEKLVSCGFEIEQIIDLSAEIKNVIAGKILTLTKHPGADRLQVCRIDCGKRGAFDIVTAATNIKEGDLVPVALDGATLAGGKKIYKGELRGVTSYGMLCSGAELSLTDGDYEGASANGILILKDGAPGDDINTLIGNDDIVLDVAITANRTDANSVYGIAREVAAVTNKPLKPLDLDYTEDGGDISDYVALDNRAPDLCPRYMAKAVKDIKITKSPDIIRNRLRAVGVRPINNVVDITNYALFEIGQPMHAFDLETITGRKIVVRRADDGEKIIALDGKEYTLSQKNLVIANEKEAMAVAGVMGGRDYSVLQLTKTIVFESARFARDNVRRTTRTINLRSDSSARFEKGVDYYSQETGLKRALALICRYGYGKIVGGTLDSFPQKPETKIIRFTSEDIERILGIAVPQKSILDILNSLTISTVKKYDEFLSIVPPYREDIAGVNDLAEEIIRIYGYDHITPTLIKEGKMTAGGKTKEQRLADKLKNILISKGAFEIVTYSFITPKAFDMLKLPKDDKLRKAVRLDNPLGEDLSVMRTTLAHSMLKTLATNYQRGNKKGRFFELAKTYIPKELPLKEYPEEKNMLSLGALGDDFYGVKEIIEDILSVLRIDADFQKSTVPFLHPGRTAKIVSAEDGYTIGFIGEVSDEAAAEYGIDKRIHYAELDAEYIIIKAKLFSGFSVISKFPAIERDLAVIAPAELEAGKILDAAKQAGGETLIDSSVFDVYTGGQIPEGQKSVAVKFVFQSMEKTLTDGDVNALIDKILTALSNIGAKLRD